ncbi:reverse transcriptase family protein [Marinilongibacter aquaticus]|uniref:reverse transcriptase family protein n=1 Tax=Marinilongibacter aquaticus TaxID=2975157 RepID=UPI0021BDCD63|nr:reverse transcriptase family protein [Marinilongibacter aquaticus]UBM60770.1 reverse transcriptase family protein [Marinilongibacter aquaticus]
MTFGDIQTKASLVSKCDTLTELCFLLKTPRKALLAIADKPDYNEFFMPKPDGKGRRLIEDPVAVLQYIQEILNDYFQAVYYLIRPEAAYGFQLSFDDDHAGRNIRTNAERHLHKPWLLNMDFKDFFHQVTSQKVEMILRGDSFSFDKECVEVLCSILTYKGRLPMGAPTSPVLSNMAVMEMDNQLGQMAKEKRLIYTRFADDLTFSGHQEINEFTIKAIKAVVAQFDYFFNENKTRLFTPEMEKTVTGVKLGDRLGLEPKYLDKVSLEIQKYEHTKEIQGINGIESSEYLTKYEQQLSGHIEFIGFIYGKQAPEYVHLKKRYDKAESSSYFDSRSWMEFDRHYTFFNKK